MTIAITAAIQLGAAYTSNTSWCGTNSSTGTPIKKRVSSITTSGITSGSMCNWYGSGEHSGICAATKYVSGFISPYPLPGRGPQGQPCGRTHSYGGTLAATSVFLTATGVIGYRDGK